MPVSLLLPLLSAWTPALAADTPPAERTVATPADLAAFIGDVGKKSGGAVLVAAAGPDAERVALKVAAELPPGRVRVVRIGILGDEETERALDVTGMKCAVRVGVTAAQELTVSTHGQCEAPPSAPAPVSAAPPAASTGTITGTPGSATPLAAAPPAGSPAPVAGAPSAAPAAGSPSAAPAAGSPSAATSPPTAAIPGVSAITPGVRVETAAPGDAAAPAGSAPPYVVGPPPPPDPTVLQSTFERVALSRVRNPNPRDDHPEADWAVRDGRGRVLTAAEFAQRTGDLAVERRISRDASASRTLGLGLAVGGGALAVAGLGVLLARDAGEPQWSEYEANVGDYRTNEEYFAALAQAEADYRAAQDEHAIIRDDRAWIAGFLAGAGVLSVVAAPMASRGLEDRRHIPALYWSKDEADARIAAYNDTIRQQIGLQPLSPPKAVIVTPPKPDDADEDDDDASEDDEPTEPSHDAAPAPHEPAPTPDPAGPAGFRAPLQVVPVIGPAWVGFTGSF